MITRILEALNLKKGQKKKRLHKSFHEMPSREQKKIIKKAVIEANREQRKLIEEYDDKFGCNSRRGCEAHS